MKKDFWYLGGISILFIAVAILFYLHLSFSTQFVYVDSSRLLNNYQGMLDARGEYQKKATSWKANIDTLTMELQNSIKTHEKEMGGMTAKERQLSEELLRNKQKQLLDYQQAIQGQAQQEDQAMTQKVVERVNAYLKKYGENHHYKIIFAANETGNIVYAQDGLDITETIIKGLNEEYGK